MSGDAPGAAERPPVSERGEFVLALGGEDLVLRPSYEAIEGFEAATGKGLLLLAREALTAKTTVGEAAQIACECVRAWGRETGSTSASAAQAKKIARMILDGPGFHTALETIAAMLSLATTGGYDSSGKLKPVTMATPSGTGDD